MHTASPQKLPNEFVMGTATSEMQGRKVTDLSVKRSWIAHRKAAGLSMQVMIPKRTPHHSFC